MLLTAAGFAAGALSVALELSAAGAAVSLLLDSLVDEDDELELLLEPEA